MLVALIYLPDSFSRWCHCSWESLKMVGKVVVQNQTCEIGIPVNPPFHAQHCTIGSKNILH